MQLTINNQKFNIILEHKDIKNIYLRVIDLNTLKITCHQKVDEITIIKFINSKAKWITSAVNKQQEYLKNNKSIFYYDYIYYLNEKYTYNIISANYNNLIIKNQHIDIYFKYKSVDIDFKYKILNDPILFKEFLKTFYLLNKKSMLNILNDLRIKWDLIMNDYNVDNPSIDVKYLKGKWGYCQYRKSHIVINSKLIHYSLSYIDEVLWHEYCHLIVPNHSKRFYNLLELYKDIVIKD